MRRILSISAVIGVVMLVGIVGVRLFGPGQSTAPAPSNPGTTTTAPAESPAPTATPGRGTQRVAATFLAAGNRITIKRLVYSKLDTPRASVGVDAAVTPAPGKGKKWIERAFVLNSSRARFQPASVKVIDRGASQTVRLSFTGIPTKQLVGQFALSVSYPGEEGRESFSVATLPVS